MGPVTILSLFMRPAMRLKAPLSLAAFLLLGSLNTALAADAQIGSGTLSGTLSGLERSDIPRVLSTEEAFPYAVSASSEGKISLTWTPASEHYLYRHRFNFTLVPASGDAAPQVLSFDLPEGKAMEDEFFGAIEAYFEPVAVLVTLPESPANDSLLAVEYQGCAAWGFCYPPQRLELPLSTLLP